MLDFANSFLKNRPIFPFYRRGGMNQVYLAKFSEFFRVKHTGLFSRILAQISKKIKV